MFVNADFIRTGTQLACWEMIRRGTTTLVDMYFHPDVIAEVVDACGLRAIIASAATVQCWALLPARAVLLRDSHR
jgi:5-methylthioadenosine/S-adenosylhomocysteine deaminase